MVSIVTIAQDAARVEKLFTKKDVARLLGMNYATFFCRVKAGLVPGPTVLRGKRYLYTEQEAALIVAAVTGEMESK